MIRVIAMVIAFLLTALFSQESMAKQHEGIAPDAALKTAQLFPDVTGSLSLNEKVSARLANLGVKLINYDVMLGEKKAGEVTRIVSLIQEGLAANLDMLVRYDDKGVVQGIVSLKPWKEGADEQDLTRLLWSFRGQDLRTSNAALVSLITGLSTGTSLTDGLAPPAPEGGLPISIKQLLLEPGAQLPGLKVKDVAGKPFDAALYKNSKLLISFLSPDSPRSGEMAQTIEKAAAQAIRGKKVSLIHIITAPAGTATGYANDLGLKSPVAADPAGLLARMFQVPYSPYLFLFNKGRLTTPVTWEGGQRLQNSLRQFLNEGTDKLKGASK